MVNRIKVNRKDSPDCVVMAKILEDKLVEHGFEITDQDPELIVSVGGDGTFIRTLRETGFNADILYVGVHCGHLGFLQEVGIDQLDMMVKSLKENSFKIEELSVEEAIVKSSAGEWLFSALNETLIREKNLRVLHMDVLINGHFLERFSGDGFIIATPIGSTAYNMSAGGSIVYPSLDTLQLTPMAPLSSKSFRSLQNSIIVPPKMKVTLIPDKERARDLLLIVDGEIHTITDVQEIEVRMSEKHIKSLRFQTYSFWTRIQEKFL